MDVTNLNQLIRAVIRQRNPRREKYIKVLATVLPSFEVTPNLIEFGGDDGPTPEQIFNEKRTARIGAVRRGKIYRQKQAGMSLRDIAKYHEITQIKVKRELLRAQIAMRNSH